MTAPLIAVESSSRPPAAPRSPFWSWARALLLPQLLLGGYLAVVLLTFLDYGISWDEEWHATYGGYIVNWYASLFQDNEALDYWELVYYGGFFDTVAHLFSRISPFGPMETRHLLGALFGVLTAVAAYKLAAYLAGPPAGLLAAVLLVLTPNFYGQSFISPADIPFTAPFAWAMYGIVVAIRELPTLSTWTGLKIAIPIGLALGVRVGGIILFCYLALAFLLWSLVVRSCPSSSPATTLAVLRAAVLSFAKACLGIGLVAYALMLVWWPWAQVDPILGPWRAFRRLSHHDFPATTFFESFAIQGGYVPWYYLPKWFLVTLPEFYFLAAVLGLLLLATWLLNTRARAWRAHTHLPAYLLLAAWVLVPITYASASGAALYDGTRHFLFVVPALAVASAIIVLHALRAAPPRPLAAFLGLALLGSLAFTALDMVRLHPYEYVYFNRVFGGGLQSAAASFETEYWGTSYKEGAEWLAAHTRAAEDGRKLTVASCGWPLSTSYFLPSDRFQYVGSYHYGATAVPDLFLASPRWGCDQRLDGEVIHVIRRDDTPLLYVKLIGANVAWR